MSDLFSCFMLNLPFMCITSSRDLLRCINKCISIELQLFPLEGVDLKFLWSISLLLFIQFYENNVIYALVISC